MLKGCWKESGRMLEGCSKNPSRMLKGCIQYPARILWSYIKDDSEILQGHIKSAFNFLQACIEGLERWSKNIHEVFIKDASKENRRIAKCIYHGQWTPRAINPPSFVLFSQDTINLLYKHPLPKSLSNIYTSSLNQNELLIKVV